MNNIPKCPNCHCLCCQCDNNQPDVQEILDTIQKVEEDIPKVEFDGEQKRIDKFNFLLLSHTEEQIKQRDSDYEVLDGMIKLQKLIDIAPEFGLKIRHVPEVFDEPEEPEAMLFGHSDFSEEVFGLDGYLPSTIF
jgi:hypothetical protein